MKYGDADIIKAVKESTTATGTLIKLGLVPAGGNYSTLKKAINRLSIDNSHWDPNAGKITALNKESKKKTIPLSKLLKEDSNYNRSHLKRRLINNNMLINKCSRCGSTHWQGERLSLHLDHINGIRNDNRLENLRLLCPNCHSLTPTYCGKATHKKIVSCPTCNNKMSKKSRHCLLCASAAKEKIQWPDTEILLEMVTKTSYTKIAEKLGVSDNAIRKRLHNHSK